MAEIIPILTLEAQLKRSLRRQLKNLGFVCTNKVWINPSANDKEGIRRLHIHQREQKFENEKDFFDRNASTLIKYFADGKDVEPKCVRPVLVPVQAGTVESDIFRFATLLWSVPVSAGYGRRLRFLVIDASNGSLIGLFALGDPVFNLAARDKWINWTASDRSARLTNVMDCFVLGAVPPYRELLGGKLVAALVRSQDVVLHFSNRYGNKPGIISQVNKRPSLALITTTSALGKSSLYNRIVLNGKRYFVDIGYTKGWGHFHISDEFCNQLRDYLRRRDHSYASRNRFGDGPNWKLRLIREGLELLGFDPNLLQHGIRRQVFCCELASNARDFLRGDTQFLNRYELPSATEIASLALDRWIIPRAVRHPEFVERTRRMILSEISHLGGCKVTLLNSKGSLVISQKTL